MKVCRNHCLARLLPGWAYLWLYAAIARGRHLTIRSVKTFRSWYMLYLPWAALTLTLGLIGWFHDRAILAAIHIETPAAEKLAQFCSRWGDYQTYSVPLAIALWAWSACLRRPVNRRRWRRIAMVCFLGASLTGLFNDFFRLTMGRPRPYVVDPSKGIVDRFYGPTFTWYGQYQSFPSGHAATSFGTGTALLMVDPPLGVVTTLYACTICWARMDLQRHYPSDVAVGGMIGIFGGLCVGQAGRVRKR